MTNKSTITPLYREALLVQQYGNHATPTKFHIRKHRYTIMTTDKYHNTFFVTDEIPQSGNEDILPSDDNLDVQFGDPILMGDEFGAIAEEAGSYLTKQQFVDWMAAQGRNLRERMVAATRLMEAATTLQRVLGAQYRLFPELPSQTHNQSTKN